MALAGVGTAAGHGKVRIDSYQCVSVRLDVDSCSKARPLPDIRYSPEDFAKFIRRKNVHQRTRPAALPAADRNDVAVAIETHALDSAMLAAMIFAENVQNDGMLERAVGADRVGTQLAPLLRTRQAVGD